MINKGYAFAVFKNNRFIYKFLIPYSVKKPTNWYQSLKILEKPVRLSEPNTSTFEHLP